MEKIMARAAETEAERAIGINRGAAGLPAKAPHDAMDNLLSSIPDIKTNVAENKARAGGQEEGEAIKEEADAKDEAESKKED
jgi:hypothetical protein